MIRSAPNCRPGAGALLDPIRVLSADAHPLLREGIATIINDQPGMLVVARAASGREAIQQFRVHQPDITLLDIRLPDISGIDTMLTIRQEFPAARIVMVTDVARDVDIQRAFKAGARGYVLKTMLPSELIKAVDKVNGGEKHIPPVIAACLVEHLSDEDLSERETQVLQHVAGGNRNRDIAKLLFIAEGTVKGHLKHIMEKLRAQDRTQAVTIAARRGYIQL
jgi:DNA-binding NarL/FixJ family response regulator